MHTSILSERDQLALSKLVDTLGLDDEAIETAEKKEASMLTLSELEMEVIESRCNMNDAVQEVYASVSPEPVIAESAEKTKRVKETPVRKHHDSKAKKIEKTLVVENPAALLLESSDFSLPLEKTVEVQAATKDAIAVAGKKVQNRIRSFMACLFNEQRLNPVCEIATELLIEEGRLVSGDAGNLCTKLKSKYSLASARAMSSNTIAAMKVLKIITPESKGVFIANPESVYLQKLKGE